MPFALGFAAADGALAEFFDFGIEVFAGLFAEDFAEEDAEGADVAAEGGFFEVAGASFEFGEAGGPVFRFPERRHLFDYA